MIWKQSNIARWMGPCGIEGLGQSASPNWRKEAKRQGVEKETGALGLISVAPSPGFFVLPPSGDTTAFRIHCLFTKTFL